MPGFETRFERLELKFVIDEAKALQIRRDIAPYCREDEFNLTAGTDTADYMIQSMYLDSHSLDFHYAKERGDSERMKLRVRKYPGSGPMGLELKQKSAVVTEKTRVMVHPGNVREAIRGDGKLWDNSVIARQFNQRFAALVAIHGAVPTLLVRYLRDAFMSEVDDYARVTMDRNIGAQRISDWDIEGRPDDWCEVSDFLGPSAPKPLVILELKCRANIPHWISEIIRHHELRAQSFSKYSIGIYITGRRMGSTSLARRCGRVLR